MDENEKTTDIVNTTDCLEAVSAFRAMKNFLFIIAFICLLLLQSIFWLDVVGLIDKSKCAETCLAPAILGGGVSEVSIEIASEPDESVLGKQAEQSTSEFLEKPVEEAEAIESPLAVDKVGEESEGESESGGEGIGVEGEDEEDTAFFKISCPTCLLVSYIIKCCNFTLVLASFLYSITLFMSIKISLTGRLGGINHISRAFFQSLFAFAFILPWQVSFPYVIHGVIYTPGELLCGAAAAADNPLIFEILRYLRFTGLWAIVIILLLFAQLRSRKWTKATLRRLGILH